MTPPPPAPATTGHRGKNMVATLSMARKASVCSPVQFQQRLRFIFKFGMLFVLSWKLMYNTRWHCKLLWDIVCIAGDQMGCRNSGVCGEASVYVAATASQTLLMRRRPHVRRIANGSFTEESWFCCHRVACGGFFSR